MVLCFSFIVSICLLVPALSSSPCEDGWRYSPYSQKCYRFYNDDKWPMAELQCLFSGAHHASVHSKADIAFLSQLARGADTIWLGAAQFGSSRDYVWTDHTPFDFEHWQFGSRPPYDPGRKCIKMLTETGEWFQSCCEKPSPYICEMNPTFPSKSIPSSYSSYSSSLPSSPSSPSPSTSTYPYPYPYPYSSSSSPFPIPPPPSSPNRSIQYGSIPPPHSVSSSSSLSSSRSSPQLTSYSSSFPPALPSSSSSKYYDDYYLYYYHQKIN